MLTLVPIKCQILYNIIPFGFRGKILHLSLISIGFKRLLWCDYMLFYFLLGLVLTAFGMVDECLGVHSLELVIGLVIEHVIC